jgi:hypothetical protein
VPFEEGDRCTNPTQGDVLLAPNGVEDMSFDHVDERQNRRAGLRELDYRPEEALTSRGRIGATHHPGPKCRFRHPEVSGGLRETVGGELAWVLTWLGDLQSLGIDHQARL